MSNSPIQTLADQNCWTQIGVWGNSTCPELARVSHCRNCSVYSAGGRRLLDRPAPSEYIESWTEILAEDKETNQAATVAHLVFRVGDVWLALPATGLREITDRGVVRSVPHRPREILLGMVNVRGELHLCVSLHTLFGEKTVAHPPRTARFLVARHGGEDWVFPVDQVEGMHDVTEREIEPLPVTLTKVDVTYTQSMFHYGEKTVAIIDENLLFGALVRRIA
jgi:chemotaxis-related protein WspD